MNKVKWLSRLGRFFADSEFRYDTSKLNLRGGLCMLVFYGLQSTFTEVAAVFYAFKTGRWVVPPYWQGLACIGVYFGACVWAVSCIESKAAQSARE